MCLSRRRLGAVSGPFCFADPVYAYCLCAGCRGRTDVSGPQVVDGPGPDVEDEYDVQAQAVIVETKGLVRVCYT